ncbi:class A beta-lactamase-related serine hydrolase [Sporolactobacillus sp. STSJ-5]|uniref:serine hydrolase n=1 Tax=Sporolactobacillus sp. STSJ-5 TaxID=2965076 RepID=UPI0021076AD7|nr:serine hydrolase [Sporolactobacillus sp. STSJ-5]MCQ2009103.1 class A beta-lactamase-related serine hydrolase [Sporolactobacillus sp. STSJ-5]
MVDLNKKLYNDIKAIVLPLGEKIEIEAAGSDGFFLSYQANIPMVAASLIKLPILLYTYEQLTIRSTILEKMIHLDEKQIVSGSGVLQVLSRRDWTIKDLLALMINVSDNTATNVLMDFLGIDNIQSWVEEQGLAETRIERRMMDERAQQEGRTNWISAHDANWMIRRIFSEHDPLPDEAKSWMLHQQFRDKLPGLFNEKDQPVTVYNKTGEMNEIDHDAAFFVCGGHSVAVSVLTSDFENRQSALAAIQNIGQRIADYLVEIAQSVG